MASEQVRFHRLAHERAGWRAIVEIALVVALWYAADWLTLVAVILASGVKEPWELSYLAYQGYWFMSLASLAPCAFVAARIVKRDAALLSSVRGSLRWPWLRRCLAIALAINLCALAASYIAGEVAPTDPIKHEWPGLAVFAQLALFLVALVPLQVFGQEYAFRGSLMQAVGVFAKNPWFAIVISAVAFAAIHRAPPISTGTVIGISVISAWLTVRTGGLEAAIAEHAIANTTWMIAASAGGLPGLDHYLTQDLEKWTTPVLSIAMMLLYAAFVVRAQQRDASTLPVATAVGRGSASRTPHA